MVRFNFWLHLAVVSKCYARRTTSGILFVWYLFENEFCYVHQWRYTLLKTCICGRNWDQGLIITNLITISNIFLLMVQVHKPLWSFSSSDTSSRRLIFACLFVEVCSKQIVPLLWAEQIVSLESELQNLDSSTKILGAGK